ncbi:MAG: hypothetical protein D6754_16365 [Alphaproteobacteria bacterium]|nr:MAG: hypothetical protein D6754_16365 [Alphaproteobacteria bacterium]
MGEDTLCAYQPRGGARVSAAAPTAHPIAWTTQAQARLDRVPPFVRRFVRQRAEEHARTIGCAAVTAEHLETLARRRLGDKRPGPTDIADFVKAAEKSRDRG